MSDVEAPVVEDITDDVPAEVEALDGIASEQEAHNVDRPVRGSGIRKHKGGNNSGTPLSDLVVGSTVEGKVKVVVSYGAFVDIGAATDALLHISNLSSDYVANVEDIIKPGETVSARILSVDPEKKQVAISMKPEGSDSEGQSDGRRKQRPRRSGGDRSAQMETINKLSQSEYDNAAFVEGEVVSVLDFGAFVRFDASQVNAEVTGELDGLVHISVMSTERIDKPSSVVNVGDKIQIRVKDLDAEQGRVALSMISTEDEEKSGKGRGGGGGEERQSRRNNQMFSESEKGPRDWKEQLEKIQADMPSFSNGPIIIKRK